MRSQLKEARQTRLACKSEKEEVSLNASLSVVMKVLPRKELRES